MKNLDYQFDKESKCATCIIKKLDDELKDLIRSNLSKICHGSAKAASSSKIYSYKPTLKAFLERYEKKSPETKTGMIGELLCHLTLIKLNPHYRAASPFFNMEEASIKKGFDAILINNLDNSFWITEVKSGAPGVQSKEQKIKSLIDLSIKDLQKRLPTSDTTIWYAAINNVELTLSSKDAHKEALKKYLEEFRESNDSGNFTTKANALLVPVLFDPINTPVPFSKIKEKSEKIKNNHPFDDYQIFAIQKSTISAVEKFLLEEAGS